MVRTTLPKVSADPKDRWRDLGSFIREQRSTARLSLRRLSELAGISNPYLSQIERGLRRPSAETLYVQAGILEPPDGTPDLSRLILADQTLSEDQKQALVRIYLSFRRDYEEEHGHGHGHGGSGSSRTAAPTADHGADDPTAVPPTPLRSLP